MTFYQELQLSSAGSKQLIKNTTDKKRKNGVIFLSIILKYILLWLFVWQLSHCIQN